MITAEKKDLEEMYYQQHLTLREIGEHYGVCRERIRQIMEEFGIKRDTNRRGGIPLKKRKCLIEKEAV